MPNLRRQKALAVAPTELAATEDDIIKAVFTEVMWAYRRGKSIGVSHVFENLP